MSAAHRSRGNHWLDNYLPYQVFRITNGLNQQLRLRLRRMNISISHWRVLGVLRAYGTLSVNEIASMAVMEQPNVSRTVSQLVHDGLVYRNPARQDSRFMEVTLSAAGRRAFDKIYPIAAEHQTTALQGFSEAEIKTLGELLHRMQENVFAETGK